MITAPIVSKVWRFCITLRDDGGGYGDCPNTLVAPSRS
jgi:hypothetical protein